MEWQKMDEDKSKDGMNKMTGITSKEKERCRKDKRSEEYSFRLYKGR